MIKKIFFVVIIFTLLYSCKTISVSEYNAKEQETGNVDYYLPKTAVAIKIKVERTRFYKGPFSDYSETYLGISDNIIEKNSTKYKIVQSEIKPYFVNDDSAHFTVNKGNISFLTFLNNTKIIEGVNTNESLFENNVYTPQVAGFEDDNFIPFKDRTVKPLVVEKSDTTWKTVLIDSIFKRVPKINKAIAPRTTKEQAYLASRFILKMRKRRLRVLTGMDDIYPDGKAMAIIMKKLDEMENRYLSLFTGLVKKDTVEYIFTFIPDKNNWTKQLCFFDKKKGINNNSGNEITISVNSNTSECNKITKAKAIVYKIPDISEVTLKNNNNVLLTKYIPLYQAGCYSTFKPGKNTKAVFDITKGNFIVK